MSREDFDDETITKIFGIPGRESTVGEAGTYLVEEERFHPDGWAIEAELCDRLEETADKETRKEVDQFRELDCHYRRCTIDI